ncbi:MAG TPA: ubiquitin-like small modifier protein 1 [Longimicrobium sp.]|uniref:ubiquitin-like small modifier protein 1 n=1 Tax=Longimicrobium sp. TaxID=2029185 RepID=UPI002EDA8A52
MSTVAGTEPLAARGVDVVFALPAALRPFAGGRAEVACTIPRGTVRDALHALVAVHPGVVDRVLDERGEVRRHVNVFVDGENIRFTELLATPVPAGATITIVAAVSGG